MEYLLNKIREGIWDLEALNVNRKNMIIAFSPLIKRMLIQETMISYPFPKDTTLVTFENIKCNSEWCENEIIIYDSELACYYPYLIKRIIPILPDGIHREIKNREYIDSLKKG